MPRMNSANDNSIRGALEEISACRNQFRTRSIKPNVNFLKSININMVEVFVWHYARKFCRLTTHTGRPWFQIQLQGCCHHQDNPGNQNAGLTGIMLVDCREWKEIHWAKSWLLCVLASWPTCGPALCDVQIRVEQWSTNQRVLNTYAVFLHTGCIFELGKGADNAPQFYCLWWWLLLLP